MEMRVLTPDPGFGTGGLLEDQPQSVGRSLDRYRGAKTQLDAVVLDAVPEEHAPVVHLGADLEVLTLVELTIPMGAHDYVNSMWQLQDEPFAGDVVNSYNDGPPEPGAKPLGPFYELESSSPALELGPGEFREHVHRTAHFVGDDAALDPLARAALGVGIAEIRGKFTGGD